MTSTYLKRVLIRDLEGLRTQLNAYSEEEQLWELPAGISNSAGTLALHLIGNVRHFIGTQFGESGYVRDREAEFNQKHVARSVIERHIDSAIVELSDAFDRVTDEMMDRLYPITVAGVSMATGQFLVHLVAHFAYHLGQIDYHRRITTGVNEAVTGGQMATLAED